MTGVQTSSQLDLKGFLNVTSRKGFAPEKSAMLGSRKPSLDFSKEGEDFIDNILSREETEDIITMLINADESQDYLSLPSFHTSSQIGGGNPRLQPTTRSFATLPSPIRQDCRESAEGEINVNRGYEETQEHETNDKATPNHGKVVERKNRLNVDTTTMKDDEKFGLSARPDPESDPGTEPDTKNRSDATAEGGHDLVDDWRVEGTTVAKHVAMGNNVTTDDVLTEVGGNVGSEGAEPDDGDGEQEGDPAKGDGDGGQNGDPAEGESGSVGDDSSRLKEIFSKMDIVEEILSMMGERSTKLSATVKDLETLLEFSQAEIENLKKENKELKKKVGDIEIEDKRTQFHTNLIEDKLDRLETLSKKKNLIFEGIPETEGRREEVEKTVGILFDQLQIGKGINFDACYRMGFVKGRSRPILVTFERQTDRDFLYAKRMDLRKTADFHRVWVNEDLGPISKRKRGIIRLIAKEAVRQGIDCKSGKYSLLVDKVKYDSDNLDELPHKLHPTQLKQMQVNDTTLAYQSEFAPFSNFYTCSIKMGKHTFFCVEQAFHFVHAKTLNKHLIATKIYLSRDVRYIKQLGAEAGTSAEWEGKQYDVMYGCIKRKFEQNQELQELLLKSGDLELVEATPDMLWGCGATLSSNVLRKREWRGRNKQGEILMVVREELRQRRLKRQNPPPVMASN